MSSGLSISIDVSDATVDRVLTFVERIERIERIKNAEEADIRPSLEIDFTKLFSYLGLFKPMILSYFKSKYPNLDLGWLDLLLSLLDQHYNGKPRHSNDDDDECSFTPSPKFRCDEMTRLIAQAGRSSPTQKTPPLPPHFTRIVDLMSALAKDLESESVLKDVLSGVNDVTVSSLSRAKEGEKVADSKEEEDLKMLSEAAESILKTLTAKD